MKKPICLIPARGGSKRVPRKNIAIVAGKPLVAYSIQKALQSDVFETVCVSSDDDEILEISKKYGANLLLKRPEALSDDRAQVKDVCLYILEELKRADDFYHEFGVVWPTNPLSNFEDIRAAYRIFKERDANYVMSLVEYSHPPQRAVWARDGFIEPYFGPQYMRQGQLLDKLYRHDGTIIFGKTEVFFKERQFYGSKAVPYYIARERTVDIDNPEDLKWAEYLLLQRNKQAG